MKRKVLSIILAAALMVSAMAGCSGGGESQSESSNSSATTSSSSISESSDSEASVAETGEAVDPFKKFDPPVEFSVVQSVTVGADQEDRSQNNNFLTFLEDTYGIKITHKWVTTPEQYDQRVALSLATNDLADVMVVDMVTMQQMIDAGQVQDITEVWNTYADDLTKSLIAPEGGTGMAMATQDGKLYGVPITTPVLESMHALFLREDWRQNLNLPEPTTFDELEEILYAFVEQDPDGNGQDDTYAIGLNKNLYGDGYELTSIANMMHAYPNAWVENDEGKVVYGSVQPEMRDVLEKLAQWYQDGLIDPEFTVKTPETEAELVLQEKMGAFTGAQWAQFMANAVPDLYVANTESDWKVWGLPSIDEEPAKPIVYDNTQQFMVITSQCENPEGPIVMLDVLHKLGAGDCRDVLPTAEDFNEVWNDWTWMPVRPESIHGNIPKWENVFAALETGDDSLVQYNYNALVLYEGQAEMEAHPEYRTSDETREGTEDLAKDWVKGQYATRFSGYVFGMATEKNELGELTFDKCGAIITDTMVDSLSQLDAMELETFTRIITGDAPIEEFDNFVKQWNSMGGEQITTEINDYYASK